MVGEGSGREIALSERVDKHVAAAAALLAQNEPFAQEVFQGARRTREAMLGRANGHQPFGREGPRGVAGLVEEAFHEGAIDGPGIEELQQTLRSSRAHGDLDVGPSSQAAGEGLGHHVLAGGQRHADAQLDRGAMGHLPDALMQQQIVVGHGGQPVAQNTSRRCQLQFFAMVGEQLRTVLAFQIRDVLGDGRLGERQLLGGSGVVQSTAHGEEGLYAKILHSASFCDAVVPRGPR